MKKSIKIGIMCLLFVALLYAPTKEVDREDQTSRRAEIADSRAWLEGVRGWSENGANLWTGVAPLPAYNVGIRTSTPGYPFDVNGNARIQGSLFINTWPISVSAAPAVGDVLKWNGTAFVPQADAAGTCEWVDAGDYLRPGDDASAFARIFETATPTYRILGEQNANIFGGLGSTASGVVGVSNNADGAGVLGDGGTATSGLWGQCNIATDFAVGAINLHTSGTAVLGIGNNTAGAYFAAGSGGAFTGTSFGSYNLARATDGVGTFSRSAMAALVGPPSGWDAAVQAVGRRAGIFAMGQSRVTGARGIGVIGLGDSTTTATVFGGAGVVGNGTVGVMGYSRGLGVFARSPDTTALIAYATGPFVGTQLRARTTACIVVSDTPATYYALHVDDYARAAAWHTGKKTSRGTAILHTITTPNAEVYLSGTGRLTNGIASIEFGYPYNEVIATDIPVTVIVTPTGECNGLYVVEANTKGFKVKELNNGKSSVGFNWIAIGREKDWRAMAELKTAPIGPQPTISTAMLQQLDPKVSEKVVERKVKR